MLGKLAIIGGVGIPANYGGFETFTEQFVQQANAERGRIIVYCSRQGYDTYRDEMFGARLKYIPIKANGWQSLFYDGASLAHALFIEKCSHVLALGVSGAWLFPVVKLFAPFKLITNIDGQEWSRKKWGRNEKIFLKRLEYLAVKNSDVVIADNMEMKRYITDEYGIASTFLPYGGNHIEVAEGQVSSVLSEFGLAEGEYATNISRIEPENNNHVILQAFSEMPENKLVMIGDWEHSDYSRSLYNQYKDYTNLTLLPAMFDRQDAKNIIRAKCGCYLHGHSVGGTSPALVEALCLGRKVFCFDVSFNRATTFGRASYFTNADDLKSQYKNVRSASNDSLDAEVHEHYGWHSVTKKYLEAIF